jgi:hypothetical protein
VREQLSGWRSFSGIVLLLVGAFNVVGGLGALFREEVFVAGNEVLIADATAWGWLLLVVGLVQLVVSVGILGDRGWARMLGIVLALLSGVFHIVFLATFPLFSLAAITLSVMVAYGLIVPDDRER